MRRETLDCDVLVVGGGINGTGIARDLAGRGWRVVLCEQDDLAAHTSSASTKLIHGGLRYLEHYEFGLVRKALQERELLLASAPHIMRPLRFVMPHNPHMRPAWMIRAGLFLYDHLARRRVLPGSHAISLREHPHNAALQPEFTRGFEYSDVWADDARLVALSAVDARERGARVLVRTRCVQARRADDAWTAALEGESGAHEVRARALVNAAGPWADAFVRDVARSAHGEPLGSKHLRLVKGSHIVVPRRFMNRHAYLFQNPDKRIVFAIPYEHDFTLIGTTDVEVQGDPRDARIDASEIDYLCTQANRYLRARVAPADVVWAYTGVRPLLDDESGDPSEVTRDYSLETNADGAPLLTVWGGKLTTFRRLAEEAADRLGGLLGRTGIAWTRDARLPGGDLRAWIGAPRAPDADFERFAIACAVRYPRVPSRTLRRLAHAYGSRIDQVLGARAAPSECGVEVAPGVCEAELDYLRREEWACTGDDVLWRRSKLGLHLAVGERTAVAEWMQNRRPQAAAERTT